MSVQLQRITTLLPAVNKGVLLAIWLLLIVTSTAINLYLTHIHAQEVAMAQARAMFEHIVLTRSWNARHGGVYVPVTENTQPNPYLDVPDRDVTTESGVALTKINPAYMTRQISELASESEGVQFHITSLNLIRPENNPTPWERSALELFEKGEREVSEFLYDRREFHYMAPLITTKGCLKCHEAQGYTLGEIRGGISVTHPVAEILIHREHIFVMVIGVHLVVFILSCIAFVLFNRSEQRMQLLKIDKESAEQANHYKGAFIANISHELRTPLNAILGMSHILSEEPLSHAQRDHVRSINEAGNRLTNMINSMLTFSKLDSGSEVLSPAPLQLQQTVFQCIELMQPKAHKKRLELTADFVDGLPKWLQGDREHIQQVLLHLLDNAVKFTESGWVKVLVDGRAGERDDYHVTVTIEDSGIGMSESQERLQQHEFTQIDDVHARSKGGFGLGLTMSRRLLTLMGGGLRVESKPWGGTKVTIHFVLEQCDQEQASEESIGVTQRHALATADEEIILKPLSAEQQQQLHEQLTKLVSAVESDYPVAMELIAELIEQYQGSVIRAQLISLSEKLSSFDSDGVIELSRLIQEELLKESRD